MAILTGTLQDDALQGTDAADRISGLAGDDVIRGLGGNDVLLGGAGKDQLAGDAGDDRVDGGDGDDVLWGHGGNDRLLGGAGIDLLIGDAGADTLTGGAGTDALQGGAGGDVLNGGPGGDTLSGGAGADVFAFGSTAHGLDTITDFNPVEDRFDLTVALQRFDSGDDIEDFVQFRATEEGTVLALNANGTGVSYTDVALMQGVSVASLPLEQLGLTLTPEVTNPFPNPIVPGDIVVDIVDFVQVPPGVAEPPLARLNGMTHADDGSGRLFVNDTRGPMYVIEDGVLNPAPVLNLPVDLPNEWFHEQDLWDGFRDFAFHPDFENEGTAGFGKLYISFTGTIGSAALHPDTPVFDLNRPVEVRHHDIIAELDVDPETLDVDLGSYRELMRIENPHDHHNIGELAFNPNAEPGDADYGMLHASIGDAHLFFPQADALNVGQDRGVLLGSIIRIDPLQDGDQPYTVPADNPFVGQAGVLPEIWAYGLRHPQYFSWDTGGDGKMIIGEIGENQVEQLELGIAGANYGWGEREGTFVIDRDNHEIIYELPPWDELRGFTYPVLQYDHDEGDAIATGYVYRGDNIPELQGKYIFGDLSNGRIFYVDVDDLVPGQTVTEFNELRLRYNGVEQRLTDIIGQQLGTPTTRAELRFGQDEDGEVYILSKWDGMIRALAPSGGAGAAQTASAGDALRTEDVLDDDGPLLAGLPLGSGASTAATTAGGVGLGEGAVAGPQSLDDLIGPAAHA